MFVFGAGPIFRADVFVQFFSRTILAIYAEIQSFRFGFSRDARTVLNSINATRPPDFYHGINRPFFPGFRHSRTVIPQSGAFHQTGTLL